MLDSMILQKQQDEQVQAQLYKLRALPDHQSRERGKSSFSPFAIILGVDQVRFLVSLVIKSASHA